MNNQWCSGSGATGAIAPVPIFQGGAPLQFLFHLFLVNFDYILQKLAYYLNYYWQTVPSHMQLCIHSNTILCILPL